MSKENDNRVEEVAKELYFEGEHFEEGTVADVTWRDMPKGMRQKYLDRAVKICQLFEPKPNQSDDYFKGRRDGMMMKEAECQQKIEALDECKYGKQLDELKAQISDLNERVVGIRELVRAEVLREVGRAKDAPKIICLCGSTRFTDIMLVKQWELTKQGHIVLSWCALPDWYFDGTPRTHIADQEGVKEIVDRVHLRKIDVADEVLVINKDYYIGESTTNEIEYAKSIGKPVKYLVEALKSGTMPEQLTEE